MPAFSGKTELSAGNSDLLCDQFVSGAREAGHAAEKIFLKDRKISYCIGCGVCFGGKSCSQKDDMTEILDKMIAADVNWERFEFLTLGAVCNKLNYPKVIAVLNMIY